MPLRATVSAVAFAPVAVMEMPVVALSVITRFSTVTFLACTTTAPRSGTEGA